jgi:hypothetical protein
MIEPPDRYRNHVPARWLDQAPGPGVPTAQRSVGTMNDGSMAPVQMPPETAWSV